MPTFGHRITILFLVAYTLLVGGILPFHSHAAVGAEPALCAAVCGQPAMPGSQDASHQCLICQMARQHGKTVPFTTQSFSPADIPQDRSLSAEHTPVLRSVAGAISSRAPPFLPFSES